MRVFAGGPLLLQKSRGASGTATLLSKEAYGEMIIEHNSSSLTMNDRQKSEWNSR
jgi:hypothetical protein